MPQQPIHKKIDDSTYKKLRVVKIIELEDMIIPDRDKQEEVMGSCLSGVEVLFCCFIHLFVCSDRDQT
jgi:hypothetical protein